MQTKLALVCGIQFIGVAPIMGVQTEGIFLGPENAIAGGPRNPTGTYPLWVSSVSVKACTASGGMPSTYLLALE